MESKPMDDIDGTLQNQVLFAVPITTVKRTSTGARIITQTKADDYEFEGPLEDAKPLKSVVKEEPEDKVSDCLASLVEEVKPSRMTFDEFLKATNTKVMTDEEYLRTQIKEEPQQQPIEPEVIRVKEEPDVGFDDKVSEKKSEDSDSNRQSVPEKSVKEEPGVGFEVKVPSVPEKSVVEPKEPEVIKIKEEPGVGFEVKVPLVPGKSEKDMSYQEWLHFKGYVKSDGIAVDSHEKKVEPQVSENAKPTNESKPNVKVKEESARSNFFSKPQRVKKEKVEEQRVNSVLGETGDFPEEPDWFLVGRTLVTALSTTKGRKLVDNEIVDFTFPSRNSKYNIVRFSTKRSGEV